MFHSKTLRRAAWTVALSVVSLAPPAAAAQESQRVRVGADVAQANLVKKVDPVYPAEARAARVQDAVVMQAVISKEGRVIELTVLSGHSLLRQSAQDAVLQWEYRPFLLNGQPVEVVTTITVNYSFQ
jgi:protein TonB